MVPESPQTVRSGFEAFYAELHGGQCPYRWQIRLATELARGAQYEALEAPTGAGKTTLVECFVFAHAWQHAIGERTLPRRLFWVIDRRGVVDQVFDHVARIATSIARASDGVLAWAGEALRTHGGALPVQVARWRGGVERWREDLSPNAPAVICSTVDQVGSRLLLRGYGRSRGSRPVDAALVATDSLIVLDEAHLSRPFAQTLDAVAGYQRAGGSSVADPVRTVTVSATLPPHVHGNVFTLTEEELAEEPIARRLNAAKPAVLVSARNRVDGAVREARKLAQSGARLIGVVLNTVDEARDVYARLAKENETLLVIGPCRPFDRESILDRIPGPVERGKRTATMFVVATQTIEVGLDLDFDAMVTACAPFSSLTQRFGRLDRSGALAESHGLDRFGTGWVAAVVFAPTPCPVYGDSVPEVWEWLLERAPDRIIDLSPHEIGVRRAQSPPPDPPGPLAPILAPWHVEALAQTSSDPVPSPDVGSFLHGERALEPADVRVAWRADLVRGAPDWREDWTERVRLRPPRNHELLALPLGRFRRWLSDMPSAGFGDVESAPAEADGDEAPPVRPVIRVPPPGADGPRTPEILATWKEIRRLAPGDTLVVAAQEGGCDEFGWAPSSRRPAEDLSLYAPTAAKGPRRPRLLVQRALGAPPSLDTRARALATAIADEATSPREAYEEVVAEARDWLRDLARQEGADGRVERAEALEGLAKALVGRGRATPVGGTEPTGLVLEPERPGKRPDSGASQPTEDDPRLLTCHARRVEELAVVFASAAGFDGPLLDSIRLAARYHDLGKLDRRFQAWLNGGEVADPTRPLAKSGQHTNPRRRERERIAAGWPKGKRHEALSASLVAAARGSIPDDADIELLLHLISVHHGQHRPFQPSLPDGDAEAIEVAAVVEGQEVVVNSDTELPWSDQVERFAALARRYGPWGLAALEAVLVLADHAASAEADA